MKKDNRTQDEKDHLKLDQKAEEYLQKGYKIEGMPNVKDKEDTKREIKERNENQNENSSN